MNKPLILIIDKDKSVRNLLAAALDLQGFPYHTASTGKTGMLEAVTQQPDLILIDLDLSDMDGLEIIRKVRIWSQIPIMVVSNNGEIPDKVAALDAGADDYLVKPFSIEELLARVRAALRRTVAPQESDQIFSGTFQNGGLKIDYSAGAVFIDGREVHLTPIEYRLLCLLAKHAGKVLPQSYILKEIWGNALPGDTPSLRVFIVTLRKKIEKDPSHPQYIQTHIGIGYRMNVLDDEVKESDKESDL
ncbi:response regulator transcription factor [Anaerolentibacter hominis]|uniref:response regulator transcription factor n=1 Tax=Anaerolentibacter hominis TaxID=3079009 RepID=UPI0031B8726B